MAAVALAGWTQVGTTPHGGSLLSGPIGSGQTMVYLPPGYSGTKRYPVLYLLHGLPGTPSEYWNALQLGTREPPYIVVTPAGPTTGEWAGAAERWLVRDVVPYVDAHFSTLASPSGRALEGLSAGGFGAVDIGLRHPGVFGTLGSWDGYFAPMRDGVLAHATAAQLRAHDPSLLVEREAPLLRRERMRFYISAGGNHGDILTAWSTAFARELTRLRLTHELWRLPPSERGHFWSATVPSALRYAFPTA